MFNRIKFANVVILANNNITGNLTGTGGFIIGGVVTGDVVSKSTELDKKGIRMGYSSGKTHAIHILKGGVVKGNIHADVVIIDGRVEGNITCERLDIGKKGELVGDADYRLGKIANGAFIKGSMNPTRTQPSKEQKVKTQKPTRQDVTAR